MGRAISVIILALTLVPAHAQESPFAAGAYKVLDKAACRACHNTDGVASATRLHFPESEATAETITRLREISRQPH